MSGDEDGLTANGPEILRSVRQRSARPAGSLRRSEYARWVVFGILLPLLPIVAKIAASWFDVGHPTWEYTSLFGDGNVLVLAVVVAAAGIGDLLFDARRTTHLVLREALVISLALVVVVLSGVAYGLVTLKQESGQSLTNVRLSTVDALQAQLILAQQNVDTASNQAAIATQNLEQKTSLYVAEVTGQKAPGTTGVAGVGQLAAVYRQQMYQAQQSVVQAHQREVSARDALSKTSADLNLAVHALAELRSTNTKQTATASLVLFAVGILIVGACIWVGTAPLPTEPAA
jgi:hypothetical protein